MEKERGLMARIERWYHGKIIDVPPDKDMEKFLSTFPSFYVQRHWTANVAHVLVRFYLRRWPFIWTTLIAIPAALFALQKLF